MQPAAGLALLQPGGQVVVPQQRARTAAGRCPRRGTSKRDADGDHKQVFGGPGRAGTRKSRGRSCGAPAGNAPTSRATAALQRHRARSAPLGSANAPARRSTATSTAAAAAVSGPRTPDRPSSRAIGPSSRCSPARHPAKAETRRPRARRVRRPERVGERHDDAGQHAHQRDPGAEEGEPAAPSPPTARRSGTRPCASASRRPSRCRPVTPARRRRPAGPAHAGPRIDRRAGAGRRRRAACRTRCRSCGARSAARSRRPPAARRPARPARSAPIARPAVDQVFLGPVGDRVEPAAEHAEGAGVAGQLPVDAVEHEAEVEQDAAEQPGGGGRRRGRTAPRPRDHDHRDRGDPGRGEPRPGRAPG